MEDQQQKREVLLTNSIENPPNSDASIVTYNINNDDAYFDSFPVGYRFRPLDEELVVKYLQRKVLNEPLPPNKIKEVELYRFNPEELAVTFNSHGGNEWYFFTPRERKYRNGERPNRAAGDGYWKATGADKPVKHDGVKVGFRKALVFYMGKAPKGDKTDWIMHEYRVNNPPKRRSGNVMRLDDWVLCRIYKKADKSIKASTRARDNATQFPQAEKGIPTQHQNNGCMSVDNSAMVHKEALMPNIFDMKSNYNHENRMGYFNAYGNVTSYQSSFPRVPHCYDPPPLDQNSLFAQHIIPDYENSLAMVEPLSSKLPLHSMEIQMKHERFSEYHHDELSSLPPFDNFDDQFVNMDNSLAINPMMLAPAPFDDDNCHR